MIFLSNLSKGVTGEVLVLHVDCGLNIMGYK